MFLNKRIAKKIFGRCDYKKEILKPWEDYVKEQKEWENQEDQLRRCRGMTEQEAIEILTLNDELKKKFPNLKEVYEVAVKALEKQIPKKPNYEGDGYADGELVYDTWICPNCEKHYEVDYDDYDYCPNCGQALDWSEII